MRAQTPIKNDDDDIEKIQSVNAGDEITFSGTVRHLLPVHYSGKGSSLSSAGTVSAVSSVAGSSALAA